jgi:hypothetical protein
MARLMRSGLTGVLQIERLSLKWLIAAFTGIAIVSVAVPTPAMAADDIGKFVYVQSATAGSVTIGPTGRFVPVEVRLVNTSEQVITAYTLSVEVTLATAEQLNGAITRDMVSALVYERIGEATPTGLVFGPGQVTGSTITVKLAPNAADPVVVVKVSAELPMIAFGDKTALGTDDAIARLAAMRRMEAENYQDVAEALTSVQGAVDMPAALQLLISKASTDASRESPGRERAQRRLTFLKPIAAPLAEHPEFLVPYLKAWQAGAQAFLEHASVHRLGAAVKQGDSQKIP